MQEDLTIADHPEISVLGDMMSLNKLPGVAEVAMQTGLYAGNRIKHQVAGNLAEKPFRYRDLGSAAYISRGRAVVSAGPLKVGGFIGWVIWLFIHIAFLTGYRNRLGALITWWFAFTRDIRRERTFTTQQLETLRNIYDVPLAGLSGGAAAPDGGAQARDDAAAAPDSTAHAPGSPASGRSPAPADVKHD